MWGLLLRFFRLVSGNTCLLCHTGRKRYMPSLTHCYFKYSDPAWGLALTSGAWLLEFLALVA